MLLFSCRDEFESGPYRNKDNGLNSKNPLGLHCMVLNPEMLPQLFFGCNYGKNNFTQECSFRSKSVILLVYREIPSKVK